MKSIGGKDIVEFIGIAAIVASLVFVGIQLKQSQEIAMSQAVQARLDTNIALLTASAENPYFVSALGKSVAGDEEPITPSEFVALRQYGTALLYNFQNTHHQYQTGFHTESDWQASRKSLKLFLQGRSFPIPMRQTYDEQRTLLRPRFQAVIDEILTEIDSEKTPN